jgi:long-chain acyl-CoA synthetase
MTINRTFDLLDNLKLNHEKSDILVAKREGNWVKFSTNDYIEHARNFAFGLLAMGFKKGDKIATVSNNRSEWNFVDMGMAMVGVVHVPVYPTIGNDEFKYILSHSDARMLIVSDLSLFKHLQPIVRKIGKLKNIFTFNYYENIPCWTIITELGFNNKIRFSDKFQKISSSVQPDDIVTIIYTSGTTGLPKGVMLSHRNLLSNAQGVFDLFPLDDSDNILSFLPLCHVYERMVNYLFQWRGCSIYYAESLGPIAQNLAEIKASAFVSVPRVIERIYDRIVSMGEDLKGVKRAIFLWYLG